MTLVDKMSIEEGVTESDVLAGNSKSRKLANDLEVSKFVSKKRKLFKKTHFALIILYLLSHILLFILFPCTTTINNEYNYFMNLDNLPYLLG